MNSAQNVFFGCVLIASVLVAIVLLVYRYQKIQEQLVVPAGAIKIHPGKIRFLFSWYVYLFCILIPMLLVLWWWIGELDVILFVLCFEMVFWLLITFMAYPYYTIIINENMVSGPTLWNWLWRRETIDLSQLDREKILHRNIGRKLGLLIFYSLDGKKILSLGLDGAQMRQILEHPSGALPSTN